MDAERINTSVNNKHSYNLYVSLAIPPLSMTNCFFYIASIKTGTRKKVGN